MKDSFILNDSSSGKYFHYNSQNVLRPDAFCSQVSSYYDAAIVLLLENIICVLLYVCDWSLSIVMNVS